MLAARKLEVGFGKKHKRLCGKRVTLFLLENFILVLVGWEEGHCNLHSCSFEKAIEILF